MQTHGSNLDSSLYNNSFAPALGGACAMGTNTMALIQTCQIQAIVTVPQRLSFSAQLSNSNRGSPLKPPDIVLPCPRNIPKLRSCMGLVAVWIWASLVIVFLFFGSMGVACYWVWASNRLANLAACPATRCYKNPKFWAGTHPPAPPE